MFTIVSIAVGQGLLQILRLLQMLFIIISSYTRKQLIESRKLTDVDPFIPYADKHLANLPQYTQQQLSSKRSVMKTKMALAPASS